MIPVSKVVPNPFPSVILLNSPGTTASANTVPARSPAGIPITATRLLCLFTMELNCFEVAPSVFNCPNICISRRTEILITLKIKRYPAIMIRITDNTGITAKAKDCARVFDNPVTIISCRSVTSEINAKASSVLRLSSILAVP